MSGYAEEESSILLGEDTQKAREAKLAKEHLGQEGTTES